MSKSYTTTNMELYLCTTYEYLVSLDYRYPSEKSGLVACLALWPVMSNCMCATTTVVQDCVVVRLLSYVAPLTAEEIEERLSVMAA